MTVTFNMAALIKVIWECFSLIYLEETLAMEYRHPYRNSFAKFLFCSYKYSLFNLKAQIKERKGAITF